MSVRAPADGCVARVHETVIGASQFLQHPKVAEASLEKRVHFLKLQGIPEDCIEDAIVHASGGDEEADEAYHPVHRKKRKRKKKKKKKSHLEPVEPPAPPPRPGGLLSCMFCT